MTDAPVPIPSYGLSRRSLLLGAGAAGGLLLGGAAPAQARPGPGSGLRTVADRRTDFITITGARFRQQGKRLRFSGTNCGYLHESSHLTIDSVLETAAAMGLTVVRAWAFIDGPAHNGYSLQPEPYVYDEASFEPLDHAVAKAGELGLRLVLPLVNNWPDYGGMQQYVAWFLDLPDDSYGACVNHDRFYTDPQIKKAYKAYAEHVLTRRNQYTGLRYNEDPTIMTFELANEPRNRGGDKTGRELLAWADEMSRHLKSLAPQQLVAVGDEGFWGDPGATDYAYGTDEGNKWLELSSLKAVDYATYHLYPQVWGETADVLGWGDQWIVDHVRAARGLGKPTVLEEYGLSIDPDTGVADADARDWVYRKWVDRVARQGGDGDQFWTLAGRQDDGTLYPDHDGYRVTYPSPTGDLLAAHARRMTDSTRPS